MFREWVSDNLRYILLILAILAVAVLAFFGIRFIRSRQSAEPPAAEDVTASLSESTAAPTDSPAAEPVVTGADARPLSDTPDEEVTALINEYYSALSANDAGRLRATLDTLSAEDDALLADRVPVSYSDIRTYVKPGPDASSLLAFVYYRYVEEGTEQVLPGLASLFLTKNTSGKYVIKTQALTPEENTYLEEASKDPDITALISQVQTEFDTASAAAESAAASAEESAEESSSEESAAEESTEESAEEQSSSGTGVITQDCNVRAGAGYNYNTLGVITEGTEVTIIGEKGVGWTHIQGGGFDGYVGTSFIG